MSPSSELIRLLDVAVRTSFQSLRDVYFLRLEICTFAVVIGVFIEEGEYFLSWPRIRQKVPLRLLLPTHRFDKWVRRLSKVGWILILLGVGGEFVYEARVSRADGWLQEFNGILSTAQQTEIKGLGDIAAKARGDAKEAAETAGLAKLISSKAVAESSQAEVRSSNAMELARSAREEADSFEKQIASALTQAAEAESHLRDALARAEEVAALAKGYEKQIEDAKRDASEAKALLAEARQSAAEAQQLATNAALGVKRLGTDRSLNDLPGLVTNLKRFENTEYAFSGVFADEESIQLLKQINEALRLAGWTRAKGSHAFPALEIFGKDDDVRTIVNSGVKVSVESPEPLVSLQSLAPDNLPAPEIRLIPS